MNRSEHKICKLFGKLYMWRVVGGRLTLCPMRTEVKP